jgi:hypothetical protein
MWITKRSFPRLRFGFQSIRGCTPRFRKAVIGTSHASEPEAQAEGMGAAGKQSSAPRMLQSPNRKLRECGWPGKQSSAPRMLQSPKRKLRECGRSENRTVRTFAKGLDVIRIPGTQTVCVCVGWPPRGSNIYFCILPSSTPLASRLSCESSALFLVPIRSLFFSLGRPTVLGSRVTAAAGSIAEVGFTARSRGGRPWP